MIGYRKALLAGTLLALGAASAQLAAPASKPLPAEGYLAPGAIDLLAILPPAPVKGEIRYQTDRRVFRAMRRLIGTTRWDYAIRDVPTTSADVMRDFSCAAGLPLSPEALPATYRLLANADTDTRRANNLAKDHYRRLRPFLIDHGDYCDKSKDIATSYDYPSGHTTRGWTQGLVLAGLIPERATPILRRARAYGESRLVCRVHNASAVEAGRVGATATMSAVRETAGFQADLAAARAELQAARTTLPPLDPAKCADEERVLGPSVLAGLR